MSLPRSAADVLAQHVTMQLECVDRLYLNVYQPKLQYAGGIATFFRFHRGHQFASSALMEPITANFIARIEDFAKTNRVPLITFQKGERKEDVVLPLRKTSTKERVLLIGKAQEKSPAFRTEKRSNPETGAVYPWIVRSSALVNQYYIYFFDDDFGPAFLKYGSYFPYNAKLCINGHEYLKRQLTKEGIAFEELDNGILSCENPQRMQEIADGLDAAKVVALLAKWQEKLPHPFTPEDQQAGYRYDISILQSEFSLTQVLDRPLAGRTLFEDIIRENLDMGRPDQVQLIFQKRITKRTPGRFRTRVLTEGVSPSLHVDYKHSKIKQYHKEGRALRTETTINDSYDFSIGKHIGNLSRLKEVGFAANRRLLDVQRIGSDGVLGKSEFDRVHSSVETDGQRTGPLRFGDEKVQTLFRALLSFVLLVRGFSNRDLRERWAPLLGKQPDDMTSSQMTYQLRRLKLHGLIERIPSTNRYELTDWGRRVIVFYHRLYGRVLLPAMSHLSNLAPDSESDGLRLRINQLDQQINGLLQAAHLVSKT